MCDAQVGADCLGQVFCRRLAEVIQEAREHIDVGTCEPIDRLPVVADSLQPGACASSALSKR